jgi:hypothetical protein
MSKPLEPPEPDFVDCDGRWYSETKLREYGIACYRVGAQQERERIKARQTGWERGGKRHILDTYAKLHEGKLGMHWIWAAIERMVWAGEPEVSTLEDFGYVPETKVADALGRPAKGDGSQFQQADWQPHAQQRESSLIRAVHGAALKRNEP